MLLSEVGSRKITSSLQGRGHTSVRAQPSPETLPPAACPCEPVKRAGVPSPSASQAAALSTLPESAEEVPPVIRMPVSQGRKNEVREIVGLA